MRSNTLVIPAKKRVALLEIKINATDDAVNSSKSMPRSRPIPPAYGWYFDGLDGNLSLVDILHVKTPNHPRYKKAGTCYRGFRYFNCLHYHDEIGWFFKAKKEAAVIVNAYNRGVFGSSSLEGQVVLGTVDSPEARSPYVFFLEHPDFHEFKDDDIFYIFDRKQRPKQEIEDFREKVTLVLSDKEIARIKEEIAIVTKRKKTTWQKKQVILERQEKFIDKKPTVVHRPPTAAQRKLADERIIRKANNLERSAAVMFSDDDSEEESVDHNDLDFNPKRMKRKKSTSTWTKSNNREVKKLKIATEIAINGKDEKKIEQILGHKKNNFSLSPSPKDKWLLKDDWGYYLNGSMEQRKCFQEIALANRLPIAFIYDEQQIYIFHCEDNDRGTGKILRSFESSTAAYRRWVSFVDAKMQNQTNVAIGGFGLFSPVAYCKVEKATVEDAKLLAYFKFLNNLPSAPVSSAHLPSVSRPLFSDVFPPASLVAETHLVTRQQAYFSTRKKA